eukprot:TRINITY_DN4982_c0_g1_i1.p1 TRINITY_DN4982_c0_g1~~TRINITY_DN4982_c0_g1_i1.p1  ORF type:complete len:187 (+),score=25.11 TRINITY_DN4982_c0_g1_i1:297-857(+)
MARRLSPSLPATPSGRAQASASPTTPRAASSAFTDEDLDDILGEPGIDALMPGHRKICDRRPRGSLTAERPVGAAAPAGGGDANSEEEDGEHYMLGMDGGRSMDAGAGAVHQQPGIGAPPPPAIVESTVAPAMVTPSDKIVGHVSTLLSLKGRRAQRVHDAFRGMVGGVASEHKCAAKSVQAHLIP